MVLPSYIRTREVIPTPSALGKRVTFFDAGTVRSGHGGLNGFVGGEVGG
jgi:heat shock protein HslJ